jgi:hypothetical protein
MDADTTQQHLALGITEIRENILLHLPVRDLFFLRLVSKEFRDTIQESKKLQEKMYLVLPNTPPELWTVVQRSRWAFKRMDISKWTGGRPQTAPVTLDPILEVIVSKPDCIRRTWWGKRWRNEHVRLKAPAYSVHRESSLLAAYISDPPCQVAVVSVGFRIEWQTSTTRPETQPQSASAVNVRVQCPTGLTLGKSLEGALDGPGEHRYKDQYGTIRSRESAT